MYRVADLHMIYLGKSLATAARLLKPGHVFAVADNIGRCLIEAKWEAQRVRQVYLRAGWLGPGHPTPPLRKPTTYEVAIKPGRNGKH